MPCGYVGLKNAGATCYMNAVLQQFFLEPGLADAVLSTEFEDMASDEAKDRSAKPLLLSYLFLYPSQRDAAKLGWY